MTMFRRACAMLVGAALAFGSTGVPQRAMAQDIDGEALIIIDDPNFAPLPIAIANFIAADSLGPRASEIRDIVEANLERSGLFQIVPRAAHIGQITDFDQVPQFADWRAINAAVLVTGQVVQAADGRLVAQFRVFDTAAEEQIAGKEILADPAEWRRVGHQIADGVYVPVTGEGPYFDSERGVHRTNRVPRATGKSGWRSWTRTARTCKYPRRCASGLVLQPVFSPNGRGHPLYLVQHRLARGVPDEHPGPSSASGWDRFRA